MDRYYFAYGSNMALWVMSEICAEHDLVGIAQLPDHRLAFTRYSQGWQGGICDVLYSPGDTVWGGLFMIGETCHDALDLNTHYGVGYTSMGVDVLMPDGTPYHVIAYTVLRKSLREFPPSRAYLDTMLEGARELRLPKEYIKFLKSIEVSADR